MLRSHAVRPAERYSMDGISVCEGSRCCGIQKTSPTNDIDAQFRINIGVCVCTCICICMCMCMFLRT